MSEGLPSEAIDAMTLIHAGYDGSGRPYTSRDLAERMLEAAVRSGTVQLVRCSCPVGWGQVRDPKCRRHWLADHTVTGAEVTETVQHELGEDPVLSSQRDRDLHEVRESLRTLWDESAEPRLSLEHTLVALERLAQIPASAGLGYQRVAGEGFHTVDGRGYHGPGEFAQVNPEHRPESARARDIREVRKTLIGLQKGNYVQRAIEAVDRLADSAQDGLEGALDVLRAVSRRCGMEISESTAGEWLEVLDALSNPKYEVRIERVRGPAPGVPTFELADPYSLTLDQVRSGTLQWCVCDRMESEHRERDGWKLCPS